MYAAVFLDEVFVDVFTQQFHGAAFDKRHWTTAVVNRFEVGHVELADLLGVVGRGVVRVGNLVRSYVIDREIAVGFDVLKSVAWHSCGAQNETD